MGWCSATQIMDTALRAAEEAVIGVARQFGAEVAPDKAEELDDHLRPFVATLARELRDGDWDCIDESEYFDRFPREMLGHGDVEHLAWLVDQIQDYNGVPDRQAEFARKLIAHVQEMEARSGTG